MESRNSNNTGHVDLRWAGPAGDVLVEVRRTNNARDVREALLSLAYALQDHPTRARGLCVVVESRLSPARLRQERDRFRHVVQQRLADAVFLSAIDEDGDFTDELPARDPGFIQAVRDTVQREAGGGVSRVTRQQVKAMLVERWLSRLPGQTIAETRRQTGASYQTVSAALAELQQLGAVQEDKDGLIAVRDPGIQVLRKLAEEHVASRKVLRFADPSGHARLPGAMAERLFSLRSKGHVGKVAVGGVIGATRYFEDLNITAAPRLDLSVYDGDARFVRKLDAGLVGAEKADGPHKVVLVLHLQRDCRPAGAAPDVASRLDCLADLLELGLQAEAEDFARELARMAQETR